MRMKSRLKNLYKYLIENREHHVKGWHDAYHEFYSQVGKTRERIQAGESLSNNDEDFLRKLLYEKSNGVASRGQSTLSAPDFEKVIQDADFLNSLQNLIKEPTLENYKTFSALWPQKVTQNNPVLVNRVTAACTLEVSTTVDSGKFNQVFSWLTHEGIIPAYPAEEDQSWFSKNKFLMKLIKEELQDVETDEFYMSQFVWVLYENLSNPFPSV